MQLIEKASFNSGCSFISQFTIVLLPLPDGALKINNPFFIFSSSFLYLLFDRGLFGQAMNRLERERGFQKRHLRGF